MIYFAKLAAVDKFTDLHNIIVEAVANADIENFAGLVGNLLHLKRLGEHSRGRLLAQNVLAGFEKVNGYYRVKIIVGADRHGVQLGVVEEVVIIGDRLAAAVFLDGSLGTLGNYIAEILDLRVRILHICRDMSGIGYITATDNGNFEL